jgi:enoyl-CoA hydratase/carnithine racemase
MVPQFCETAIDGHILTVTLNRPAVLNALHPPASEELAAVFDDFEGNHDLWIAIVTGAGDAFCAGNDLKYQAAGNRLSLPPSGFGGLTSRFACEKVLIAAVHGVAMGGGCEMALACDLVVADETATFALPEPRVGLAALAGGPHRLARQIALKHAMGMALTGRRVGASEAVSIGVANEVVPVGEVVAAARRWAGMIIECAPLSVRATKQMILQGLEKATLAEAVAGRYEAVRTMLHSQDLIEGPRAFAEKRPPAWTGR